MLEAMMFWTVSVIDPLAALGLFYLMVRHPFFTDGPTINRVAGFVLVCGLAGQTFRNFLYLQTGISPTDAEMPLWVFKDYGVAIVIFSMLVALYRSNKPD